MDVTSVNLRGDASWLAAWRLRHASTSTVAALLAVGVATRVLSYASGRSLTLDEAFLGLNLQRDSPRGLLGTLDWNSAAPPGFLEAEKLLTHLFGESELALRSAPFVAGVLAVGTFALLARRLSSSSSGKLAILLFVGVPLATSYSALVKPYAFDLLCVTALYVATLRSLDAPSVRGRALLLAGLGVVAPTFSYASIFAIAASASVLIADAVATRSRAAALRTGAVVGSWLSIFAVAAAVHGETVSHLRQSLHNESGFTSLHQAFGAARVVSGLAPSRWVDSTFGGIATVCAGMLCSLGAWYLARRAWRLLALLVLPVLFVGIASFAGFYPALPRTLLFLAPTLAVLMAEGSLAAIDTKRTALKWPLAALLALVLAAEFLATIDVTRAARRDTGIKPVMDVLATRTRPGDTVYLNFASQYPFAYYLACGCNDRSVAAAIRDGRWPVGVADGTVDQWSPALRSRSPRFLVGRFTAYELRSYLADLGRIPERGRVWIVLSFLHPDERGFLLAGLDRRGRRVGSVGSGNDVDAVTAYLYSF
jgi:hypothetical protein